MIEQLTRKIKAIHITPEAIINVMFDWHRRDKLSLLYIDIPDDAKINSAYFNHERNVFVVIVWSDMYPEVPLGEECPVLRAVNMEINLRLDTKKIIKNSIKKV